MKLKDFIKELNQFDPELDIVFSDSENYPYSFSRTDIGKLGAVNCHYVIDETKIVLARIQFEGEEIEFDKDYPVKDIVVIKIDYWVF